MTHASIRLNPGPANNTALRQRLGAAAKLSGAVGSSSPSIRVKPPTGSQLSEYCVPGT